MRGASTAVSGESVAKTLTDNWRAVWTLRTGSSDGLTLARTRLVVDDMDLAKPRATDLTTLTDSRMRRSTHYGHLPEARHPGEITHLDVYASGGGQQPREVDGVRTSTRLAVLFVDGYSRYKAVYFCDSEVDVPYLARHYLSELGRSAHCGGHFILEDGCARHMHSDGGKSMNSQAFADVLMEFGLASNVTSAPHTPSSNGIAERSFNTITPDIRAALDMADMGHGNWTWALRHGLHARNKLATRPVPNPETRVIEYKTPFQLYWKRRPSLKHACIFGAPCRLLLLGAQWEAGKYSKHTIRGRILGRGEDGVQMGDQHRYMLGWIVLTNDNRIMISRHVSIDERFALRRTPEGGLHSPFEWTGPLDADSAAAAHAAAETEPLDLEEDEPHTTAGHAAAETTAQGPVAAPQLESIVAPHPAAVGAAGDAAAEAARTAATARSPDRKSVTEVSLDRPIRQHPYDSGDPCRLHPTLSKRTGSQGVPGRAEPLLSKHDTGVTLIQSALPPQLDLSHHLNREDRGRRSQQRPTATAARVTTGAKLERRRPRRAGQGVAFAE